MTVDTAHPILDDLVAQTEDLATLPETVVELLHLLQDPIVAAADVQKVIERDPALTANILKLANSAFYGAPREVPTVRQALVLLGNRSVATLGFATGMAPILRRDLVGYDLCRRRFWNHALISAAASSVAVTELGASDLCCEAFTAGLVHDLGMLIIDEYLAANHLVLESAGPVCGVRDAEREVLGFDHCQAGARLAETWGFPEILIEPIRLHHDAGTQSDAPVAVRAVAAGNVMAQVLDEDLEIEPGSEIDAYLARLGLPTGIFQRVQRDLTENLQQTLAQATRPPMRTA